MKHIVNRGKNPRNYKRSLRCLITQSQMTKQLLLKISMAFFVNIGNNLVKHIPNVSISPCRTWGTWYQSLFLDPVTPQEIAEIIKSLKNGSPVYDEINNKILQLSLTPVIGDSAHCLSCVIIPKWILICFCIVYVVHWNGNLFWIWICFQIKEVIVLPSPVTYSRFILHLFTLLFVAVSKWSTCTFPLRSWTLGALRCWTNSTMQMWPSWTCLCRCSSLRCPTIWVCGRAWACLRQSSCCIISTRSSPSQSRSADTTATAQ